jgi:hypothetical protein
MADVASGTSRADGLSALSETPGTGAWTAQVLGACLVLCAALQLHLATVQGINWDEFRFLSDIYAFERGDLGLALQTFHVHFFGWLTRGIGNEVAQIIVARFVMLGFEAATIGLIYAIARRFADHTSALLAAVCFISFSFVLRHGGSFRYDPIATALSMGSVYLLLAPGRERAKAIAAGGLVAVAGLVTMKSVLFLPLLAAVALFRLAECRNPKRLMISYLLGSVVSLTIFAALHAWHVSTLGSADSSSAVVARSVSKTLGTGMLFPQRFVLMRSVLENPVQWGLLATAAVTAIREAVTARSGSRMRAWLPVAFLVPLATVAVYRNAYPYFYAFMLAPAVIVIAVLIARAEHRRLAALLAIVMTAGAFIQYMAVDRVILDRQRMTISAVHEIFPTPVPFIDHGSMPASFVQAGFFMSTWGMEQYRTAGRPVMRSALAEKGAVFLIDNSPRLNAALANKASAGGLLPQDARALRENLVHHWGPIWIIGKTFQSSSSPTDFEILVPGRYTLESSTPIFIDGKERSIGSVIELAAGRHSASSFEAQKVVLRWGDHLTVPTHDISAGELFAPL